MTERELTQGDTLLFDVDCDIDLTGALVTCTLKYDRTLSDPNAILQKTVGNGISVPTPTNGIAAITLSAKDTADIPAWTLVWYDVQYETALGVVKTAETGTIFMLPGTTGTYS